MNPRTQKSVVTLPATQESFLGIYQSWFPLQQRDAGSSMENGDLLTNRAEHERELAIQAKARKDCTLYLTLTVNHDDNHDDDDTDDTDGWMICLDHVDALSGRLFEKAAIQFQNDRSGQHYSQLEAAGCFDDASKMFRMCGSIGGCGCQHSFLIHWLDIDSANQALRRAAELYERNDRTMVRAARTLESLAQHLLTAGREESRGGGYRGATTSSSSSSSSSSSREAITTTTTTTTTPAALMRTQQEARTILHKAAALFEREGDVRHVSVLKKAAELEAALAQYSEASGSFERCLRASVDDPVLRFQTPELLVNIGLCQWAARDGDVVAMDKWLAHVRQDHPVFADGRECQLLRVSLSARAGEPVWIALTSPSPAPRTLDFSHSLSLSSPRSLAPLPHARMHAHTHLKPTQNRSSTTFASVATAPDGARPSRASTRSSEWAPCSSRSRGEPRPCTGWRRPCCAPLPNRMRPP